MLITNISKLSVGLGYLLAMFLILGACQAPPVTLSHLEPTLPGGNDSPMIVADTPVVNQSPETPTPQIKKTIEWNIASGNFIIPPAEVRETIDENCKKLGYDRGVIVSMSLFGSKVTADFDCRGADAI